MGYGQFVCMALGVPSCIGIDIAVSGLGSLVAVVGSYPSYLGYLPWAGSLHGEGQNHLSFEEIPRSMLPTCRFLTMSRLQSFRVSSCVQLCTECNVISNTLIGYS